MSSNTTKTNQNHSPFSVGATPKAIGFCGGNSLFVEQRSTANYYTPYKFSGKEKDEETSYSYFGARYYMSDVSVWLSVDPMRDKYPYQSPFSYVGNRPVMVIDPKGEDEWDVDKATGNMQNVKTTSSDVLFQTIDGKRTGIKQEFSKKVIGFKQDINTVRKVEGKDKPITLTDLFFESKGDADVAFDFLADHTDVEWSKINANMLDLEVSQINSLHTSHEREIEFRGAELSMNIVSGKRYGITIFSHSHPEENDNDYTSKADIKHKNELIKHFPNCTFILRYSGKERSYKKDNPIRHNEVGREQKK